MEGVASACEGLIASAGARIWVGFSGGMDSTVLLHGLAASARAAGCLHRLAAVHVDHGLSPASGDWARRCVEVAGAIGVEFKQRALSLEPGSNLEARARSARYRVFRELLGDGDVLALAHHADDQVESVLLHLFQGRGLYGMPAERVLGGGRLVRPLLALPRRSLAAYAAVHKLAWIDDPANEDPVLDRNFLRHRVVPALSERFPGLPGRLARLTEHASATATALEEALSLDRNPLPLSVLDGLSRPVRQSVLRHWLIVQDAAAGVSDSALADFLIQLESANDRQPRMSLGSGWLARHRRQLYLVEEAPVLEAEYRVPIGEPLDLPHGRVHVALGDVGEGQVVAVNPPLAVTFAGALPPGTAMRVNGQGRKVRELMRAAGIPPWIRESLPLLKDEYGIAALPDIAVRDAPAGAGTVVGYRFEPAPRRRTVPEAGTVL